MDACDVDAGLPELVGERRQADADKMRLSVGAQLDVVAGGGGPVERPGVEPEGAAAALQGEPARVARVGA